MENFIDQTITRAEKHKNEVVTNLGIDDIRNAFGKISISTKTSIFLTILNRKRKIPNTKSFIVGLFGSFAFAAVITVQGNRSHKIAGAKNTLQTLSLIWYPL